MFSSHYRCYKRSGAAGHSVPSGSERGRHPHRCAGGMWEDAGPPKSGGGALPGEDFRRLEGALRSLKSH